MWHYRSGRHTCRLRLRGEMRRSSLLLVCEAEEILDREGDFGHFLLLGFRSLR